LRQIYLADPVSKSRSR